MCPFGDLREWKEAVLVCPKHKLATPKNESFHFFGPRKSNPAKMPFN